MFLFGWGKKTKNFPIAEAQHIIAVWNYFHIFWCPVSFNLKWHLISDKRSEDREVTEEEVKKLLNQETVSIGVWNRFGLLIVIAILVSINYLS